MALTYRIDPWDPNLAPSTQFAEESDESEPEVDVRLQPETDDWHLMDKLEPRPLPSPVAFIDGVQRQELRAYTKHKGDWVPCAFASLGVGAVFTGDGEPRIEPQSPYRLLALSSGASDESSATISINCGSTTLDFVLQSESQEGHAGVRKVVDSCRRALEESLGRKLVEEKYPLVIVDGRLRFRSKGAVGLTKTLHRTYLPAPQGLLIEQLQPYTRTPVFEIRYHDPVYSWYTRLAHADRIYYPLAGVVRLETTASAGIEAAVRLADLTTVHLPRFASSPIWDARAPQNLYPFAALEQRLRHELGDHLWVRRAIEAYIIGGAP